MRKKFVIGNWKMQGTLHMIQEWVPSIIKEADSCKAQMVLCPPSIYVPYLADLAKNSKLAWGAQDVSNKEQGAFTGQLSATMLKEFGCRYVIVGHSERRHYNHENDHLIAEKFEAAQAEGLIPILCVGETEEEHKNHKTKEVITRQIKAVLKHVGVDAFGAAIIAYEPVWAIGTGLTATPKQAQAVHEFIRALLADEDIDVASHVPIIYGGSVKPENASELFAQSDIDGGLVGGASLEAEAFIQICEKIA